MSDSDHSVLLTALADAQEATRFIHTGEAVCERREKWVMAFDVRPLLPTDQQRGLGPRLAALERRGLAESVHRDADFHGHHRYDVCWRLTDAGWQALEAIPVG